MPPPLFLHLPPSTPSVPPSVVCIEADTGAEGTFSPLSGLSDPPGEKGRFSKKIFCWLENRNFSKVKSESLALLPNPAGESNINSNIN